MSAAALAHGPVTPDQVRAIHVLKAKAGLSEPDYRAALAGFGAASSKELSRAEAGALIERLKGLSGADAAIRPASATVTGPYAGKLRALWISGFHLGVVRERDDRALIAFIERQTGLAHPRFLTDPASARRATPGPTSTRPGRSPPSASSPTCARRGPRPSPGSAPTRARSSGSPGCASHSSGSGRWTTSPSPRRRRS